MYTEKIFKVKSRKDIYNFIKKNPGVHFRKISRNLNIPSSTLSYHISYLVKRSLLTKESENGYLRFYISQKIGKNDKKLFNILRETVPRNIILYLFLYFESSQKEMIYFATGMRKVVCSPAGILDKPCDEPSTIAISSIRAPSAITFIT